MAGEKNWFGAGLWGWVLPNTFIRVAISMMILWILWYRYALHELGESDSLGTLGDSFGALNVLLTGFAFAAVYYQLSIEKRHIDMLEKEIKERKKADLIAAQPYLVFAEISIPTPSDTDIRLVFTLKNYRSLITDIDFECSLAKAECELKGGPVFVGQLIDSDSISIKFTGPEFQRFKRLEEAAEKARQAGNIIDGYSLEFGFFYRDGLGGKQSMGLRLGDSGRDRPGMKTIKLAEGWSWDHPKKQTQ